MSWQNEIPRIVRFLTNNFDTSDSNYLTDDRIQEMILVSLLILQMSVDFPNIYQIDVSSLSLTPDPTLVGPNNNRDNGAIVLTSLQCACLIDQSQLRNTARNAGIQVRSDRELIDTKGQLDGIKEILKNGPCASLQDAIFQYKAGVLEQGYAVLTAFSSASLSTNSFQGFTDLNSLAVPYNDIGTILQK